MGETAEFNELLTQKQKDLDSSKQNAQFLQVMKDKFQSLKQQVASFNGKPVESQTKSTQKQQKGRTQRAPMAADKDALVQLKEGDLTDHSPRTDVKQAVHSLPKAVQERVLDDVQSKLITDADASSKSEDQLQASM